MASPVSGTPFFQNLAEIDLTLTSEGRPITIWRSQVDLPLEELANLLSPPDANPVPTAQELVHEYRGVTYQTLPSLNVLAAQIAPNAFCVAEREKDLCEALKRWEQGRVARLETPLRTVWEKTQGDARLAITDTGADPGDPRWEIPKLPGVTGTGTRFPRPDWAGLELTCGDSLELQMMAGFFSEADAALGETAVRDAVAPLAAQAEQLERDLQRLPAELQPPVQAAQDLGRRLPPFFAAMMMSRHGVQVQVRGSWSMEDAEEVVRLIVVIQEALQDASR